ncbi:MAG: hypothetical protein HWN66_04490 [Candidatus Helarchaeota archaeon]|nr:hypothetical protein [Candidatus Helarchaeota archaeon]
MKINIYLIGGIFLKVYLISVEVVNTAIDVYETKIGTFKVMEHPERTNLVFVQRYIPIVDEGVWADMGHMKRKEFLKLITPHNPKRREDKPNTMASSDPFWKSYALI